MGCLVVKLGSSIVANDRGEVRHDVLARICDEVAALHDSDRPVIIVTSGAIARGMGVMSLPLRPRAMDELQAASAVGQGKLYQVYDELLLARGVPTAQVLLTFFDMSARTHYLNARQTLRKLLEWRVVPVINENDTTTTDEISFGNNDFLAAQVAILLGADLLLLLTDAGGVYTADPAPASRRRAGPRGGGLRLAVRARHRARHLAARVGRDALQGGGGGDGDRGRHSRGGRQRPASRGRSWRRRRARRSAPGSPPARGATRASSCGSSTPSPSRGRVLVDAGAARALREGGTSLLPVGVVEVSGDFDAGDAVEIAHEGGEVGKGISNYSAAELRQVLGLKSADVRHVLPRASAEAVHRDYFVLA